MIKSISHPKGQGVCTSERRQVTKPYTSRFLEKLLVLINYLPVLRTNTRGQGEYPKASELTIVKELCKFTL